MLLERFPITWNRVIEQESLNIDKLEHVLTEKVEQLFRDMLQLFGFELRPYRSNDSI